MWELDYKESWVLKKWCFWTVVLEKTLENPLDCTEIKPVSPKGNRSWIVIGRLMLKLKLQHLGHLMWRADSFEKTLMLGKIEGGEEKGTTEDEMAGWHHRLNGHEFRYFWVWWYTGRPGMLQSMGSQRVGHDWATELNWTEDVLAVSY